MTKVFTTHPNKAKESVGVVMFKRLVTHTCTGKNPAACKKGADGKMPVVADVHKMGFCVDCREKIFPNRAVGYMTEESQKDFLNKCLPKAIDDKGAIKDAYKCTGKDKILAEASIAGF